ncbi:MAG: SpaH/EbpB family LPXTG-anchored major pilin [Ruminococcus sp.]|nr:SpaH/EbpB family LPXTG-anchored major pilin [Ruminococcus sp.]MDY2857020.1 SpaH/EbpB family LPXTG-anchored major pilin [Oscillospiraceae bacterium]
MKKFAAMFISVMLIVTMTFSITVSAAPEDEVQGVSSVLTQDKGTLTLTKYEKTSDDQTSTDGKEPVSGAEFTAYKVANLTGKGLFTVVDAYKDVKVTVDGTEWSLEKLLTQDEYIDGEVHAGSFTYTSSDIFQKLIPGLQEVSKTDTTGYKSTESAENKGTYTFGNLPLGVYLVVETKVPAGYASASQSFLAAIPAWDNEANKWNYDVTASPKDSPINPEKIISQSEHGDKNDAVAIGDLVAYEVTANLPYYGEALPTSWTAATTVYPTEKKFNDTVAAMKYTFVDTMSKGLTFYNNTEDKTDRDNMTITVDRGAGNGGLLTLEEGADKDYTLTTATDPQTGETTITVDFNWAKINQYQGKTITFSYNATLNENAVVGVDGDNKNKNTVLVKYVQDPQVSTDPILSDISETEVYTYGFELTKLFENKAVPADVDATAVEFTLTHYGVAQWVAIKNGDSGKYTAYGKNMSDEKLDTIDENEGKEVTINGEKYTITKALHPDSTGKLVVRGLNDETYTLEETKSVNGYSKLASRVDIVVTADKEQGNANKLDGTVTAKMGDTTLTNLVDNDGIFTLSVNNVKSQFDLPLTGGAGILMFTIGGGVVIAVAIIIFAQLRKKKTSAK